jgi:hypothetical protein
MPPRDYLDPNGATNLDDMLRFHGKRFGQQLERHAVLLEEATKLAEAAFDALVASPDFRHSVSDGLSEWKAAYPSRLAEADASRLVPLAAERVVNGIVDVPDHYVDAPMWPIVRGYVEAARTTPQMDALRAALGALADDTVLLIASGKRLRDELCDAYDLPPAPSPFVPMPR